MPDVENSEPSRFHPVNRTRTQSFSAGCSMPSPGVSTFKKAPDVVFPAVEVEAGAATSGGGGSTACCKRFAWICVVPFSCCAYDSFAATPQKIAAQMMNHAAPPSLCNGSGPCGARGADPM